MGIDIHMWIEGKDVEGNWFVINPRYVDYKNPEKVRAEDVSDILKEKIAQCDSEQFGFGSISYNELEEYLFTNMHNQHLATIAAVASIQNLYRRINELCFEIVDDDYNSLDKNTVRLVFWFD